MGETLGFAVFILAAAAIIGGVIYSYVMSRKRREELFALASEMGYNFSIADPFGIPQLYGGFQGFDIGYDQEAYNVMSGRMGDYDVKAFDYKYTTGSGKSRQTHHGSAVIADTNLGFHSLLIRPENFLDRAGGALGFEDIDFESEEFSRKFYVRSTDKKFAYDVIHPRIMEFLLANPGWTIELFANSMMVCTGSTFRPEQFREATGVCKGFLALLPEYLLQKLRGIKEGS